MENAVLSIFQEGLSLEALLLVAQLVLSAFAVLWIRGWILKTLAWNAFRRSTVMGIGTKVTVTVNGTFSLVGTVLRADKNRVVIKSGDKKVFIPTTKFIQEAWTIHDAGSQT
jgi:hypothetical protein